MDVLFGAKSGIEAVVAAQWIELLLPKPKIRGSNPVIGNIFQNKLSIYPCHLLLRKEANKQKEARNRPQK